MKKTLIIKNSICVLAFALFAFTITSCVGSGSGNDGTKSTTQNVIPTDPKCFNFDKDTKTITGLMNNTECDISHIVIPTTIDDVKVTAIGNRAFRDNTSLRTVSMPEVTTIGNDAFNGNTALRTVNMDKVTTIGNGAFQGNTALITVTLPISFKGDTISYFPNNFSNFDFIDHQI